MITREEIIDAHIAHSNLNERIDIGKNALMLGREHDPILNYIDNPGASDMRTIMDDNLVEKKAWELEYSRLDKTLQDSGYPPLTEQDRRDLMSRSDEFPPVDYVTPQDWPTNLDELSFELLKAIFTSEELASSMKELMELFFKAASGEPLEEFLQEFGKEWLEHIVPLLNPNAGIDQETNLNFLSALNFIQRSDPLALDLDGDGIETISANTGITFDFDGDGLKTGTGWIKGDDGLLVLDRNGNGRINSGAELFGVDTVKANGQKAKDGFDALRDLDSNGDGVFDAQDEQFANMRVWQDLNQDGIAQAHELKSLAEHAIVAINLNSTASNTTANGNRVSAVGTFVRGDGSQEQAANLDLASNPFYREYGDRLALNEQDRQLANMQGSGAVRDLREAAAGSQALRNALSTYSTADTRQEQLTQLDDLNRAWVATSIFKAWGERIAC